MLTNHVHPIALLISMICLFQSAFSQKISREEAQADIIFLQEALTNGHPGSKKEITQTVQALEGFKNSITDSIDLRPFFRNVRYCVTQLNCVHTAVDKIDRPLNSLPLNLLPFDFAIDEGKLFLIGGDSTYTINYPVEVVSVNKTPSSQLVDMLWHYRSSDGNLITTNNSYVPEYGYYFLASLLGFPDTFSIQLAGKTKPIIAPAVLKKQTTPPVVSITSIYAFEDCRFYRSLEDSSVYILDIDGFANHRFRPFYKDVFNYLAKNNITNLVIDLRDNLGGNRNNVSNLLGYFLDSTQHYQLIKTNGAASQYADFKIIFLQFLRFNIAEFYRCKYNNGQATFTYNMQPHKQQYRGKIYVLINGKSASASGITAGYLNQYCQAVLIGEEAAGGNNGNNGGSYARLILPNSKVNIRFPVFHLKHDYATSDDTGGVLPDITTTYSLQEIMQQVDKEMRVVYELVGN
ncbi:MAG TPA: S41 family peptidase [Chitinophagales bacterium]|nr:S41 family peptidase [Chitinophagales bacterium]HRG86196.1 S41 family peptidase [Chitinophagales bacterium]HRH54181.1 S41 family peptidase [Chitinophagales bacterium]